MKSKGLQKLELPRFVVSENLTLKEASEALDKSGFGIIFVTNAEVLVGCFSYGDLRRFALSGGELNAKLYVAMNKEVKKVTEHSTPTEIQNAFRSGVKLVPVVDSNSRLIDIIEETNSRMIPLSEPNLGIRESQLVNECLDANWISSTGRFVSEFEELFVQYTNAQNGVAVSNGTLGLVLALKALGISTGDEVIVPSLTFGATANAVIQVGAIPIFVDVQIDSMCLDPSKIEEAITDRTRCIIPVHLYGQAADLDRIMEIIAGRNIKIIEDAAEAIGTLYKGKHVGTITDAGVFSFFANKTITTGEGGMVLFKSKVIAANAKKMRSHGFSEANRYVHEIWGSNFRLTNVQAAIGVAQMERISDFVAKKQEIAKIYNSHLAVYEKYGLMVPAKMSDVVNSNWLYTILLPEGINPQALVAYLQENMIESRRIFEPLHLQPVFRNGSSESDFTNSINCFNRGICLPSSTLLEGIDIKIVASKVAEFLNTHIGI
jgi:perosamine synthetase